MFEITVSDSPLTGIHMARMAITVYSVYYSIDESPLYVSDHPSNTREYYADLLADLGIRAG
ncbi:hypothetical protein N7491_007613 [Penicillium cf. griseofulvum]|uniref:Uncharacterized protein n=1 Tax=Penicillium cf. griseofulvum TaxID=2972120 RepID=A0A9W9IW05_9EURO|nr:hypothetical protein N7472_009361 [Penicillium cf. griseofulvum]KAJ5430597.1 hypothetical protein N7491_007613 [Penicillium cf. griseofulvum]KAJ5435634.1 hypothetical protein N7445_006519 [Penicillium cf. griseofulvum]